MARRAERNEWGLTAHQQKRYDVILDNMEQSFLEKQPISHDYRYSPYNLILNLRTNVSIKPDIEELEIFKTKVDEVIKFLKSYENFDGNENEIVLSAQEATYSQTIIAELCRTILRFKQKSDALCSHAEKLVILQELQELKDMTKDKFNRKETMKDLLALDAEFVSMKFNVKTSIVYAETPDVILTDGHDNKVNLGPFILSYKTKDRYLTVRARAKKPFRHKNSKHFHPHCKVNGSICLGEGQKMLQNAHENGDLFTIFLTLKNIINTYNINSPYAKLETWIGTPCDHCGINSLSHMIKECTLCGDNVCENCWNYIHEPDSMGRLFAFICSTCETEEDNQCIGYEGHKCNSFVDGRKGRKRCNSCENDYKKYITTKTKPEIADTKLNNINICAACKTESIYGYNSKCLHCENVRFCTACADANICEFCNHIVCPDCMAPCSECKIETHIQCMIIGEDEKLFCRKCYEKKV